MDIDRVTELIRSEPYIAFDTETTGLKPFHGDKLIGISFYFPQAEESYYLPFRHEVGENLPIIYLDYLKAAFQRSEATFVGHNIKFDLHIITQDGFAPPVRVEDTMIAAHLLNENEWLSNGEKQKGAYSLKRLAAKYLGQWAVAGEEDLQAALAEYGLSSKSSLAKLPAERLAKYAEYDAEITWKLREFYILKLEEWGQLSLYYARNDYLLKFLLPVEANGMRVDKDRILKAQGEVLIEATGILNQLQDEAKKFGNPEFNPNSPKQVQEFLEWHNYHLPSTGANYLKPYQREGHKWPGLILQYRQLTKRNSSFYEPYLRLRDSAGLIHTTFLSTGTVTGRLASMEPNMQQVPRDKTAAVKYVFRPRPGYVYVFADYKQLELRLAVHYAEEQKMKDMFLNGVDMHQYTADALTQMLNYPISRYLGKTANFGLLYGMGYEKAAFMFGISEDLAKRLVYGWRQLYPEFGIAMKSYEALIREKRTPQGNLGGKFNYIRLFNGRVRHYNELMRYQPGIEFGGWNSLIQGAGAAITEASALRISEYYFEDEAVLPILTVHDSIGYEVKKEYVDDFISQAVELMENWPGFAVPIKVEVQVGHDNWRDME